MISSRTEAKLREGIHSRSVLIHLREQELKPSFQEQTNNLEHYFFLIYPTMSVPRSKEFCYFKLLSNFLSLINFCYCFKENEQSAHVF